MGGDILAQGGNDDVGLNLGSVSIYGKAFPAEYKHRRASMVAYDSDEDEDAADAPPLWLPNGDGAVACVPRKGKHDSQFWVTCTDKDELAHLNSRHFVFGQVVQGLDFFAAVFDAAEALADHKGAYQVIQKRKITIVDCGECGPPS